MKLEVGLESDLCDADVTASRSQGVQRESLDLPAQQMMVKHSQILHWLMLSWKMFIQSTLMTTVMQTAFQRYTVSDLLIYYWRFGKV